MSDRDEPGFDDEPQPDGPITEGVRIIGAQEAGSGEDSDRPRPAADDLPKVRISSGDREPSAGDRFGAVPVVRPGGSSDDSDGGGHARVIDAADEGGLDEEGFVLPHWTEPPTGQVPKVVIGDEQAEVEATPSAGPRWRDEGEREGHTDFEDLVEDAPGLGSLDESDEDDFFHAPETEIGTSFRAEAGDRLPDVYLTPLLLMSLAYMGLFGALWLVRIRTEVRRRRIRVLTLRAAEG
jgi:hypothetical protein